MQNGALTRVIGVGECATSADPAERLATYALGSCIAVAVYDPVAKVGGLLHFLLPDSSYEPVRRRDNPYISAETGVPELLRLCIQLGARKSRLLVCAAGGASVLDNGAFFNVGRKNQLGLQNGPDTRGTQDSRRRNRRSVVTIRASGYWDRLFLGKRGKSTEGTAAIGSMKRVIRVLIVDDSAIVRKLLTESLNVCFRYRSSRNRAGPHGCKGPYRNASARRHHTGYRDASNGWAEFPEEHARGRDIGRDRG